ncbi:halocyanin domain-containing protein [Haladaptatus sp. DYSN1]|uniref:halocyanin domain-containing protein n=1 Tax=unclassified Haladaptatus TaxID=2622732 RepID=UPI0024058BBD|nr:halocyanin domain-containing protein [Haladaptatus sp. DYSN1]
MTLTRRSYLQGVGALALVGTASLAGCSEATAESGTKLTTEPGYDGWFNDVGTYRGTFDLRNQSSVTVTVGAKDSLGHFKFAPAAIAVSPGTTVRWEWSGKGGSHDVVALDGGFKSPMTDRAKATFTHTFDALGIYKYYCTPHRSMGMKGAVVVLD